MVNFSLNFKQKFMHENGNVLNHNNFDSLRVLTLQESFLCCDSFGKQNKQILSEFHFMFCFRFLFDFYLNHNG